MPWKNKMGTLTKIGFVTFLGLILISLFACRGNENSSNQNSGVEVEIPEDFLDFYTKFHLDSNYQLNHIVFPLSENPSGGKWLKEDWVIHKPIQGKPGEYLLDYVNFQGIIRESIRDSLGVFNMERRFSKMGDNWNLIYYKLKTQVFE